jgi:ribosomal protein S18 acetylase RimI-like enzyme
MKKIQIVRSTVDDAREILKLQKLAYQSEAERYDNYDIPPLTQTIEEVIDQFKTHIFLKAISGGKMVGTVRAHEEHGICYIGRLAVHPDRQNLGIGTALMKAIEGYYRPERFELFVGSKSNKNIYLYRKLGYSIYKTDKYECGDIEIYYMEKKVGSI